MDYVVPCSINKESVNLLSAGSTVCDLRDGIKCIIGTDNTEKLIIDYDRSSHSHTHTTDKHVHIRVRNYGSFCFFCCFIPSALRRIVSVRNSSIRIELKMLLILLSDVYVQKLITTRSRRYKNF